MTSTLIAITIISIIVGFAFLLLGACVMSSLVSQREKQGEELRADFQ